MVQPQGTWARPWRILASLVLMIFVLGVTSPTYAAPSDKANDNASSKSQGDSSGSNAGGNSAAATQAAHKPAASKGKSAGNKGEGATRSNSSKKSPQDLTQPQPTSNADANEGGANGQCPEGPYCSTRDGSPSLNGNGDGKATGKPCAGCVGKADNKNPKGQMPNGSDHNAGYECDRNNGIGKSNPAHTGCTTPPVETCPDGSPLVEGEECEEEQEEEPEEETCPDGSPLVEGEECEEIAGITDERPRAPAIIAPRSVIKPAAVKPAAKVLPATGSGILEQMLGLTGAVLLLVGLGTLIVRRRPD